MDIRPERPLRPVESPRRYGCYRTVDFLATRPTEESRLVESAALVANTDPAEILGAAPTIGDPVAVVTTTPDADTIAAQRRCYRNFCPRRPDRQLGTAEVAAGAAAAALWCLPGTHLAHPGQCRHCRADCHCRQGAVAPIPGLYWDDDGGSVVTRDLWDYNNNHRGRRADDRYDPSGAC